MEYDGRPTLKLSTDKATLPSPKQVYRFVDRQDRYERDVIALASERQPPGGTALLGEAMAGGRRVWDDEPLEEARRRFAVEFDRVPVELRSLRTTEKYDVGTRDELASLARSVAAELRARELA